MTKGSTFVKNLKEAYRRPRQRVAEEPNLPYARPDRLGIQKIRHGGSGASPQRKTRAMA